jgi:uncharacterized protein DUF4340
MSQNPVPKKKSPLRGKGGVVAAILTVALLVWLFVDFQKPVRDPDAPPPVSDFVHLSSGDVQRVELKRAKDGFVLVKQGEEWGFQAPGQYRANAESVKNWLKGLLEDANVDRVVEGKAGNLATYGLDKPAVELILAGKSGGSRTLQVGKEFGATGSAIHYAREARDGRLFMLSSTQVNDLKDKKLDDLREKRLVRTADNKDVQKVVLQRPAGTVELVRRGENKWDMTQPFPAPADDFEVDSLITQARTEALSFVESNAADLAKYGLDRPRLTVQVSDKKGQHGAVFGKQTKDSKVYAARPGEREVVLVSKSMFDDLNKMASDLRDAHLISLEADKISFVELHNPNGTMKFQKASDGWQFLDAPNPAQKKARQDMVQQIVDRVRDPALKHVEEGPQDLVKYGLDKPQITVQVNDGSGTSQVFMVGKKSKDGNFYAKGSGAPNAVFEIQPQTFRDLNVKAEAFRDTSTK